MLGGKHTALLDNVFRDSWTIPRKSARAQLGAGTELLKLHTAKHLRPQVERGSGQPVVVFPGFLTSDASTLLMRQHLKRLGYKAKGWKRGTNWGFVRAQQPAFVRRIKKLADKEGQPIHLIGWSLGGFLAREVARDCPDEVAQVISIAAPIVGGPKYTIAARYYRMAGICLDKIEKAVDERRADPITVPLTLIYSKSDGIVAWQACIDTQHDHAEHVEVNLSHAGMGVSGQVFSIVGERLARHSKNRSAATTQQRDSEVFAPPRD